MTLPEVYAIFAYWDSSPPVTALLRRLGVYGLGIKPHLLAATKAAAGPEPARVKADPDKSRPLPDPLTEHDRAVEAFLAQSGGAPPAPGKAKKEISLEDFVAKLTGTPV